MPGRVGKAIKNDEAVIAAIDDPGVGVRQFGQFAEDATLRLAVVLRGRGDVCIAPRGPEVVHCTAG